MMKRSRFRRLPRWIRALDVMLVLSVFGPALRAQDPDFYVKKETWNATVLASREALMEKEVLDGPGVPMPDLGASEFTFLAWIRTTHDNGALFARAPAEESWAPQGKVLFLRGGRLHYDVGWVGVIDSGAKVNDGEWHHVALAGGAPLEFFVDGDLVKSGDLGRAGSSLIGPDVPEHQYKIGTCTPNFPDESGFIGSIDEVRLFDRRLTGEEVKAAFENGEMNRQGMVGHWTFDGDGSDASGNGLHGRIQNAVPAPGKSGMALRFDGGGCVVLPPSPGTAARDRILELVRRDFDTEAVAREIAWETGDGIWAEDWEPGDWEGLARRYAGACRNVGGLPGRAAALVPSVRTLRALQDVRGIYLLSRASDEAYSGLKEKIQRMSDEIAYLDDKYGSGHVGWNRYKTDVARLFNAAESAAIEGGLGDARALDKIARLEESADKILRERPLYLPSGPKGPGRFGSYYTRLKYSLEWDRPWRIGPLADVVVRFDEAGYRFVFWRGTSYIPCWVTENGIWYTNEFCETSGGGTEGCVEPMSDKQTRYSHVRVIESHPARTVVHWRYALCDVEYRIPYPDPMTGWGDWADEYYTIYPDGVAVREIHLQSSKLDYWHEFQEAIVINQPGTMPEDNIELAAVSLANLDGESRDHVWTEEGAPAFGKPEGACIQVINLKAGYRPFAIVPPEGARITPYRGHAPGSHFNCWDHWPISMDKNWTRVVQGFDRPSHTSLSHITWPAFKTTDRSVIKLLLNGMTDRAAKELIPLARSWLHPPPLKLIRGDPAISQAVNEGYDPAQRAYVLRCMELDKPATLVMQLLADPESPAVNPAFVIRGWGSSGASLEIDGADIVEGNGFRLGHRRTLEGIDLIVWIKGQAFKPILVVIN